VLLFAGNKYHVCDTAMVVAIISQLPRIQSRIGKRVRKCLTLPVNVGSIRNSSDECYLFNHCVDFTGLLTPNVNGMVRRDSQCCGREAQCEF